MSYNPEDPRLTAYALGEMPENERAVFEAGLDDADRAEIEAIRSLASLLGRELAAEATPSLTDSQRVAIHEIADQPLPRQRRFHWVVWLAAAASFMVLLGLLLLPHLGRKHSMACDISSQTADYDGGSDLAFEPRAPSSRRAMDAAYRELPETEKESATATTPPASPAAARPGSMAEHVFTRTESLKPSSVPFPVELPPPAGSSKLRGTGDANVMLDLADGDAKPKRNITRENRAVAVAATAAPAAAPTEASKAEPVTLTEAKVTAISGKAATIPIPAPGNQHMDADVFGGGGTNVDGMVVAAPAYSAARGAVAPAPAPAVTPVGGYMVGGRYDGDGLTNAQEWKPGQPPPPSPAAAQVPVLGEPPVVSVVVQNAVAADSEAKVDQPNREAYDRIRDNPFMLVRQEPLSTFSIDVDTASYANVRRYLQRNHLPPPDAVRIEELVNYFDYAYEEPKGKRPFSVSIDLAQCPWAPEHRLARVALKGREPDLAHRPASNLVFLLDVSGSMNEPNKLPLVKETLRLLVNSLSENDRVAIVVYAGASGMVLPSTTCDHPETVLAALDRLQAGGSTNGGAGIQLAYQTAVENFIKGGTNRVILATDGDFNVGVSNRGELTRLIEEKAKSGVFLTVLGYGRGNLQDALLEELSGKGNGTYAYIDSVREAQKVMVQQLGGTLLTIAKDVKIQVEFNPGRIGAYRLIGYENRLLANQDFNDDTKDAGEIGAGLTVTAFYELVPRGVKIDIPGVDTLKYQTTALADEAIANEAMTVKLRYKLPDSDTSTLLQEAVKDQPRNIKEMSDDYVFATAVATFGMVLRDSPYKGSASLALAEELAQTGARRDPHGYRQEFLELIKRAMALKK